MTVKEVNEMLQLETILAEIIWIMSFRFFQKAFWVSIVAAVPCAIIGTYIVVKRISLITGSISHATFGGLGIAHFFGFNPVLGALAFGSAAGLTIAGLQRRVKGRLDTLLSFLWAFGMAIGLVFIAITPGYAIDLFTYLFGNILLIPDQDVVLLLILTGIVVILNIIFFFTFKAVLFDENFAAVRNVSITAVYILFYLLLAFTLIIILKLVGVVLLIAYMTLPAATAQFFFKRLRDIMVSSLILMVIVNVSGLFASHFMASFFGFTLGPGPIIVLCFSVIYIIAISINRIQEGIKAGRKRQGTQQVLEKEPLTDEHAPGGDHDHPHV